MAKVIYEIEMNAENAPMIDQVNRLLLGNGHTAEAGVAVKGDSTPAATKPPAKPAAKVEKDTGGDSDDEMSLADFKTAVKKAKAYAKEVGRDEAKEIMNSNGAANLTKVAECTAKELQAMLKAFTA